MTKYIICTWYVCMYMHIFTWSFKRKRERKSETLTFYIWKINLPLNFLLLLMTKL